MTQTLSTDSQPLGPRQQALVNALRSGKYSQVNYFLHTTEGFCCLGVACDLIQSEDWRVEESGVLTINDFSKNMPLSIQEYYSFIGGAGDFKNNKEISEATCLAGLNDNGKNFEFIAEFIENNAALIFTEVK